MDHIGSSVPDELAKAINENASIDVLEVLLEDLQYDEVVLQDALILASASGYINIVRFLVEHMDTSDLGRMVDGNKANHAFAGIFVSFWEAASHGHVEVVKYLLEVATSSYVDIHTALRLATENGHTSVMQVLLDAGADEHADDYDAIASA